MSESITLEQAQSEVDAWIKTIGVKYFSELTNTAILMEEVGELARIMARTYGEQSSKANEIDDVTDEDMFKVTKPFGITVKIGTNKSAAEFHFNNSTEARALLRNLPSKLLITKVLDKLLHIVPYPSFGRQEKD